MGQPSSKYDDKIEQLAVMADMMDSCCGQPHNDSKSSCGVIANSQKTWVSNTLELLIKLDFDLDSDHPPDEKTLVAAIEVAKTIDLGPVLAKPDLLLCRTAYTNLVRSLLIRADWTALNQLDRKALRYLVDPTVAAVVFVLPDQTCDQDYRYDHEVVWPVLRDKLTKYQAIVTKHNLLFDSRGCPTSIKAILATSLRSTKLVQYSAVATNVEMWLYHCFSNDGGINRVVIQPYLDLIMTWLSGQAVSEAQTLILQFIKRYHVVPELFYQLLTDLVQTQQLQSELSLVLQGCWQNIVLTKSADFPCGLFHHRVRTAVTDSVLEYCVARHRFSGEPDDEDTWLTRLIRHGHLTEAQIDRVRQEFVGNANILRAIAQNHTRALLQPLLDNYYLP